MTEKTLMVVDCDAGIDDAQAIMMALAQPHIEVLAITCVVGNQHDVRQICRNVLRILKVCGKLDKIPVYKGAETTLLHRTNAIDSSHFHGVDGLGDKPDPEAPDDSHIDSKNGILALIDLVKNHPGEITVVALGPLTNLALAARVDSDFSKNIKEVSIMGGNTESRGNVAIAAEFNFYTDSEAAQIVLNDFKCPVYVNSWELTLHHPLDWEWYKQWQETKTQKGEFMKSICECGMKYYMSERGKDETLNQGWVACDPVAMAVAIDKKIITEMQELHATVELNGTYSRGQMIVDWCNHLPGRRKSFIVTKINVEILKELMKKSIE